MNAPHSLPGRRRPRRRLRLFALALPLLLAASGAAPAHATVETRAVWTRAAERLLGRLPVSVSLVAGGRLVYAHAGSVPRAPASNEKLLLSMALLDRFGPRYRIPTGIEGSPPVKGAVKGDLWLVGHGDPELDDRALRRLARKLHARGIHSVRGSVVGVADTFTRERWAPGWQPIALRFVALPTALVYDANAGAHGYVFDPERRAAAALTADLRALGIHIHGRPRAGPQPKRRPVLAAIRSAPLQAILRRQNRDSLNLDAEALTKLLGAAAFGPPGSIAKGARAIQRWARRHGVRIRARDGSGLSYQDSITSNGLARLLADAGREPWGAALRSTLPRPGQGTLAGRLLGLPVQAKSGTLFQQVSALSGWVRLRSGRWAAFSILSQGLPKTESVALEDELVALIAGHA